MFLLIRNVGEYNDMCCEYIKFVLGTKLILST